MIRLCSLATLCLLFTTAYAGQLSNGLNNPGLSGGLNAPGIDSGGSGGNGPPPAGCSNDGAADFSNGCAIAVFGH